MIRQLPPVERLLTRIHGLDAILHGGLLPSGIYIVMGPPGAGKTVLGNQLCFNHVAAGGRAVYIGLLSETHTQMFAHLQSVTFFTQAPIAQSLYYFSGYGILEREGLKGLLEFVRRADLITAEIALEEGWDKILEDLETAIELTPGTKPLEKLLLGIEELVRVPNGPACDEEVRERLRTEIARRRSQDATV